MEFYFKNLKTYIMSRYILSFFAVIIAISLAAFTAPNRNTDPVTDYYFAFDIANHTPTQTNVEDPANWLQVSDLSGCNNKDQVACKIRVAESSTNSGSPRTLKPSTVIMSDEYQSTGNYFVTPGGSVLEKSNRQQ
jgi:hypothetical protein